MEKTTKLLIIGPFPPPITGAGLTNQQLFESLSFYFPKYLVETINTNSPVLSGGIGHFTWHKVIHQVGIYRQLRKIFSEDKVYLTIGLTFWGVLKYAPYIFLAKILHKEIILHIHSDYLWQAYQELSGLPKWLFKTTLSLADKGIVLSPRLRRNLEPFIKPEAIYIVSNCVSDDLFEFDLAQKIEKKFKQLKIVYLSNLMEEKGILDFLEALWRLKKAGVPFEACLAGEIEQGLEAQITPRLAALAPETRYLGVVTGQAKKDLLLSGNVFVLPTYYAMEGQPISILEAMATGNVILTTAHAGIPDIFCELVNGYTIQPRNPQSIFERLLELSTSMSTGQEMARHNAVEARRLYRQEIFIQNLAVVFSN